MRLCFPDAWTDLYLPSPRRASDPSRRRRLGSAKEKRSGHAWFDEANATGEDDSEAATDEEIREQVFRSMPFNFARFGAPEAAYLDTFRSEPINGDALRVFGQEVPSLDLRNRLRDISAPTLVITGEDDFICGPVCGAEISAAIPDAREVIIRDAGHMVVFEQRRAFHDEVANFLDS